MLDNARTERSRFSLDVAGLNKTENCLIKSWPLCYSCRMTRFAYFAAAVVLVVSDSSGHRPMV